MKAIVMVLLIIPLFASSAYAYNFGVKVTLNNTENSVYIPSVGEINSADINPAVYSNLPHFFVASYLNGLLTALVPFGSRPSSISVGRSGNTHSIQAEQEMEHSNIFLVFSQGDWKDVDKRMGLVESGKFLGEISPSFSFGLGLYYPIKIILEYSGIGILNDVFLQRGTHNIVIENKGVVEGEPKISIKSE